MPDGKSWCYLPCCDISSTVYMAGSSNRCWSLQECWHHSDWQEKPTCRRLWVCWSQTRLKQSQTPVFLFNCAHGKERATADEKVHTVKRRETRLRKKGERENNQRRWERMDSRRNTVGQLTVWISFKINCMSCISPQIVPIIFRHKLNQFIQHCRLIVYAHHLISNCYLLSMLGYNHRQDLKYRFIICRKVWLLSFRWYSFTLL